jgi:hypothetical protein
LSEKNLSPLRQEQWLDTTEIKCSKTADSSRWRNGARHHRQKSTTKIQTNAWMQDPPKQMHFFKFFLPSTQNSP